MLALQRAAARPAAFLDARRASRTEVAPARAAAAPRSRAVQRAAPRLRVSAVAGAAVVCASASDDNAAEAQAWIAAWRAKQAGGQPVAAKAAAAASKPNAVQAGGSAAGSSAGAASVQAWAHFAVAMAAFLAADRGLMAFAASNGAARGGVGSAASRRR